MIQDGSAKPEQVNSQEGADSETFVTASDVARPSAKQTEKDCRMLQSQVKSISIIWGNVHGCNDE